MTKTFKPIPVQQPTIEDFQYGYAKNSRNIIPELKFHYSHLKYIPLIQFVNSGINWDTIFHNIEYQMREIVDFKWDNNIRRIYFYDGGKISVPFNCYFVEPETQNFFELSMWNLDGTKQILSKTIKFKGYWYDFVLPEETVNEIGKTLQTYIDNLRKYI